MKKLRIYIDTSVIGGCFDPEFQFWSNGLMRDFREGRFGAVLSDVTAAEVKPAAEIIAFFRKAGEVARREAKKRRSTKTRTQRRQRA